MLPDEEWQKMFAEEIAADPMIPQPYAAMKIIQKSLHIDDSSTLQELLDRIQKVRSSLKSMPNVSSSIESGYSMYLRFITRSFDAIESAESFDEVRRILTLRGEDLIQVASAFPVSVGKCAMSIFQLHRTPAIVTYSWNLCVLQACKEAAQRGYCFKVYVTEGQPQAEGQPQSEGDRMLRDLRDAGVNAEKILDYALGYYLTKTSCVVVGAEGVATNGGMVARLGTATLTAVAASLHQPTYVLAECYRFNEDIKPLQGENLPPRIVYGPGVKTEPEDQLPSLDYTPPEHISRIITDLGTIDINTIEEIMEKLFM